MEKNKKQKINNKWYDWTYIIIFVISTLTYLYRILVEKLLDCHCSLYSEVVTCNPSYCNQTVTKISNNIFDFTDYYFEYLPFLVFVCSLIIIVISIIRHRKLFIILPIIGLLMLPVYLYDVSTSTVEVMDKKPIIYIYPEHEMNLKIKLGNEQLLTHTYPIYNKEWNIKVDVNGSIYDYNTKRNYYALYWEGIDNSIIDTSEGFIVKGKNTVKFLEDKLEYLGLNEREINEFIIYWLPKLENNKYNYIRFKTTDEVNKYMLMYVSEEPDTLIRIYMDFKPLNKKINVKEQKLNKQTRRGFTIVEWGARELK